MKTKDVRQNTWKPKYFFAILLSVVLVFCSSCANQRRNPDNAGQGTSAAESSDPALSDNQGAKDKNGTAYKQPENNGDSDVVNAFINGAGHLIMELRDGSKIDKGVAVGSSGSNSSDSAGLSYMVTFKDYDDEVLKNEIVGFGKDAVPPVPPAREDHTFVGWSDSYTDITGDRVLTAQYKDVSAAETYIVQFVSHDGAVLKTEIVGKGEDAEAPENPNRAGYTFDGWDADFKNVETDITVYAQYTKAADNSVKTAISVDTVTAAPGGKAVCVAVSVKNNPGILGAALNLTFDEGLTLVDARNGDAFSVLNMTSPGKFTSPCRFVWDGQDLKPGEIKDGEILILTFDVADNVKSGMQNVSLSYDTGSICDYDLQDIEAKTVGGGIKIL